MTNAAPAVLPVKMLIVPATARNRPDKMPEMALNRDSCEDEDKAGTSFTSFLAC
jgi:hypothetical protein